MRTARETRIRFARISGALVSGALVGSAMLGATDARAQVTTSSNKPLPNVLLLVDTSGSMERMPDGRMPSARAESTCTPGSVSEPNRWGMLIQALTGNLQPYYSCEELSRAGATSPFAREYGIASQAPYDVDYFLPYHRPMTGNSAATACVLSPYKLPGASAGAGVGPSGRGAGGNATDFPEDALATVYRTALNASGQDLTSVDPAQCIFDQAPDGQLDAARDYVRFALMTFDNDIDQGVGVTSPPTATPNVVNTAAPFLGQWSYLRSNGNPLYSDLSNVAGVGVQGHPPACAFDFFEVGARNEAAPPWEGRLVKFPEPEASIYDIQRVNSQVQQVLAASRPFGATPLDGMLDDARDYYWYRDNGPKSDPYSCRDKFIILLTDGAPNLDMRPACGENGLGDVCPYPHKAAEIADLLKTDSDEARQVTTFVIGFSVNGSGEFPGDGFPAGFQSAPNNNCKTWYDKEGGNDPVTMATRCEALKATIPAGSTADACCKLNEIALKGSDGKSGPYFAESQADIVLSFGRIMANIINSPSTRTLPAYSPTAEFSAASFGSGARSGQFIASFIPNTQRPWSGEIDRTRFQCSDTDPGATEVAAEITKGDYMSANLATQSKEKKRFFISVLADSLSDGSIDSAATIRPFANPTPASFTGSDGIPASSATEVTARNDNTLPNAAWPKALGIDGNTCKRSKAVKPGVSAGSRGTVTVPALEQGECTNVVWGFTTAYPDALSYAGTQLPGDTGAYDFNVRCGGSGSSTTGTCSVSGKSCAVGGTDCSSGEICVPECAALGAIFRSNPTVVGPPAGFLREEGFRTFQGARSTRRPTLFVATTDGILHAFKAMEQQGTSGRHELWSFVPPAVLPKLATNYPAGNQILLDGSPIVRETIWERGADGASDDASGKKWHTTLVAGLGAGGGGYYALNVTDADCGGTKESGAGDDCLSTGYEAPSKGQLAHVSTSGVISEETKKGPHFLWQLTDILKDSSVDEKAKVVRQNKKGEDMVALFGRQSGTPAIGMVQIKVGTEERQVGVAILPGGLDGPPVEAGTCPRVGTEFAMHDTTLGSVRTSVRKWGKDCDAAVPGRGVTIVRLDNGEVVRHFGRLVDTPKKLHGQTSTSPFDSPMVGVPVVYPDAVGVPIQKIFIGDADGTLWRIDLTSTDPTTWSAGLFQDLYAGETAGSATAGQPIQVPPVLSTDEAGQVVVNVATGDQENLIKSEDKNYVFSIREKRDPSNEYKPIASINWYKQLADTESCPSCQARVTGPMVVFDRTLYFATYTPLPPSGATAASCGAAGRAHIWGLHYTEPSLTGVSDGGLSRYCTDGDVDASGLCSGDLQDKEHIGDDLVPGITLRTSVACSTFDSVGDEAGGLGFASITPQEYHLSFGIARPSGGKTSSPAADRTTNFRRPTPRASTKIDSWSLVIE